MSVDVLLEPYHQTFSLPREFIQNTLQGSLLADALEFPEATLIPLTNPVITPRVMQFLVDYSQGREPDKHIPDLIQASGYLGIPWMLYYVDPLYDAITDKDNWNSLNSRSILSVAIQENKIWVVGLYLNKGIQPKRYMVEIAIQSHALDTFRVLLQAAQDLTPDDFETLLRVAIADKFKPGVDILLERNIPITLHMLQSAVSGDSVDILATLLNKAQTQPTFKKDWTEALLAQAAKYGQLEILDYLISQTDVPLSASQNYVLNAALRKEPENIEAVAHMFISNPRFDPNLRLEDLLTEMAVGNMYDSLVELMSDPRTRLTCKIIRRVLDAAEASRSYPQILDVLRTAL